MRSYSGKIFGGVLALLAGFLPLFGQTAPEEAPRVEGNVIYLQRPGPGPAEAGGDFYLFSEGEAGVPALPPPASVGAAGAIGSIGPMAPMAPMISFVSAVGGFGGGTVTGAPYSAEAVTEIEQRLADGNRIVRKTTATIYRDSEGRTRRDQTLGAIGPWVVGGDLPRISSIFDPVGGFRYTLNHARQIAHKLPAPALSRGVLVEGDDVVTMPAPRVRALIHSAPVGAASSPDGSEPFELPVPPPPGVNFTAGIPDSAAPDQRTESLGTQLIEGVQAEGTRSISTIPAGAIGNDFAIEIVSERWYSPELQTVILSLHKDPRMGETTYRLTNIQRTEPSRSLFDVPEGYTVVEPGVRAFPPPSVPPAP